MCSQRSDDNVWYVDSGAECHVCTDSRRAINIRPASPFSLTVGDGGKWIIDQVCDVELKCGIKLVDVACAFEWKSDRNYISMAKLALRGGINIQPYTADMVIGHMEAQNCCALAACTTRIWSAALRLTAALLTQASV